MQWHAHTGGLHSDIMVFFMKKRAKKLSGLCIPHFKTRGTKNIKILNKLQFVRTSECDKVDKSWFFLAHQPAFKAGIRFWIKIPSLPVKKEISLLKHIIKVSQQAAVCSIPESLGTTDKEE